MPHFTDFGGTNLTVQSEKASFGSFEPRQAMFQEAFVDDQLIGFKGGQEGEELFPTNSFLDIGACGADLQNDTDFNGLVISVRENISGASSPGGTTSKTAAGLVFPGLYDLAGYAGSVSVPTDIIGGTSGTGGTTFMTETIEPPLGMNIAGLLNPVPEDGGHGYDCTIAGADHYLKPKLNWDAICDLGTA